MGGTQNVERRGDAQRGRSDTSASDARRGGCWGAGDPWAVDADEVLGVSGVVLVGDVEVERTSESVDEVRPEEAGGFGRGAGEARGVQRRVGLAWGSDKRCGGPSGDEGGPPLDDTE